MTHFNKPSLQELLSQLEACQPQEWCGLLEGESHNFIAIPLRGVAGSLHDTARRGKRVRRVSSFHSKWSTRHRSNSGIRMKCATQAIRTAAFAYSQLYARTTAKEIKQPLEGVVNGEIPPWLKGSFLVNGPGQASVGPDRYRHAFDGLALLREFTVSDGRAWYRHRFLQSETFRRNQLSGRIVVSEFGTAGSEDPCKGALERFISRYSLVEDFTDNALVNVTPIGDQLCAMTESPYLHRINASTLDTMGRIDLRNLASLHTIAAHPHTYEGYTYLLGTRFTPPRPKYVLLRFPNSEEMSGCESILENARVMTEVPLKSQLYPSYIHSFAVTQNWIVLIEQSLIISLPRLLLSKPMQTHGFVSCMQFDNKRRARFHVIDRKTGALHLTNIETEPLFVFHHINAFEQNDGSEVVVDVCAYDDDAFIRSMYLDHDSRTPNTRFGQVRRFVLDLEGGCSSSSPRLTHPVRCYSQGGLRGEMPRINELYNGRRYRYAYLLSQADEDDRKEDIFLSKLDLDSGDWLRWQCADWVPSEPVMVPKPGSEVEDDGVLLSPLVHASDECQRALLVLDAASFRQLAFVRFFTDCAAPATFHGCFLQAS
uniref:Putative beta beta-carotene n=1 Tax=Amblyomma triste TaxID=251400 RepID=A0A023GD01_AMBTT